MRKITIVRLHKYIVVNRKYFSKARNPVFRKITTESYVYVINAAFGFLTSYSWTATTTPSLVRDFASSLSSPGLWRTDEFVNLMRSNMFCSIKGFQVTYTRSSVNFLNTSLTGNWINLPQMSISPLFAIPPLAAVDFSTAVGIDGCLDVSILTTGPTGISKYYGLPPFVSLPGGSCYGCLAYCYTYQMFNLPSSYSFAVALGSSIHPEADTSTSFATFVGSVKVSAYCEFVGGWSTSLNF